MYGVWEGSSVGIKALISACLHSAAVKTVPSVSSAYVFVLFGRVRPLKRSLEGVVGDSGKDFFTIIGLFGKFFKYTTLVYFSRLLLLGRVPDGFSVRHLVYRCVGLRCPNLSLKATAIWARCDAVFSFGCKP